MALKIEPSSNIAIDNTDCQILHELQRDARITLSELGRRVHLTQPAVKERLRRLTDSGVLRGFHADIDMSKLGYPIRAIIRVTAIGYEDRRWLELLENIPEVAECYSVTGTDSFMVKVMARSIEHLDQVIERVSAIGKPTTSIVLQEIVRPLEICP